MVSLIVNYTVVCPLSHGFFNKIIKTASHKEKKIKGVVELNVVGDGEMRKINHKYRDENHATDVLSFAWKEEKEFGGEYLGQIFLAYPVIKRQAKEHDIKIEEEAARMLAHGLLHLVGYDHDTPAKHKKMFDLQEKIIVKGLEG